MTELHAAYLSLGSNIEPEVNLSKAVRILSEQGEIRAMSTAWETEPVGTTGENYLNACISYGSRLEQVDLKIKVLFPIETRLGRHRNPDKYAPRPIDIDLVIFDGLVVNNKSLDLAYVVVPLAEILPNFRNPATGETLLETATRLRRFTWLEARRGVLG